MALCNGSQSQPQSHPPYFLSRLPDHSASSLREEVFLQSPGVGVVLPRSLGCPLRLSIKYQRYRPRNSDSSELKLVVKK